MKHGVCNEVYVWNSSTCASECDEDCETDEYLKNSALHLRKVLFIKKQKHRLLYFCHFFITNRMLIFTT